MDTPEYDLRVSDFDMPALDNLRAFMATRPDTFIPRNYVEAMERPDLWEQPIKDEMDIMRKRSVFTLVPRPSDRKVVGSRWVFAIKFDENGRVLKRKARLVVQGFSQIAGVDFDKTYASVVRLESIRMSAAIAAHLGLRVWQVDSSPHT